MTNTFFELIFISAHKILPSLSPSLDDESSNAKPFLNRIDTPARGPTGRGFQLRDGSGSGIGKNISGRIGYGLGTGIFIIYLINRVLSGSANLDRVFFGYIPTSYLSHGT